MRKDAGFSLGELITIMGILTVLAALAIPNFIGWRNKAQLSRAAQDMYSQFQKAKIEAVRRNAKCMITFGASDFQVYVDADDSWNFNAGDQQIRRHMAEMRDAILVHPDEGLRAMSGSYRSATGQHSTALPVTSAFVPFG